MSLKTFVEPVFRVTIDASRGPCGFKVVDAETGKPIPTLSVEIKAACDGKPATLTLTTCHFDAEYTGPGLHLKLCPKCRGIEPAPDPRPNASYDRP